MLPSSRETDNVDVSPITSVTVPLFLLKGKYMISLEVGFGYKKKILTQKQFKVDQTLP